MDGVLANSRTVTCGYVPHPAPPKNAGARAWPAVIMGGRDLELVARHCAIEDGRPGWAGDAAALGARG
ncbi:hypothetical protein [Nonomuraea sp. LPB2021202275-12-8]|uniref:hypothetical protein n=1 Tax=Nonomuraea sp. LPB2021202275-12-8 TaxID=3120159 RepID=UPI00300D735F